MAYLQNAPRALVSLAEHPNPFREQGMLQRLLADPIMEPAWKEIEKRILKDLRTHRWDQFRKNTHYAEQYRRLWSHIRYTFIKSCIAPPSRTKKRDHFRRIARDAEKLASSIAEGPLDRLLYEFFPFDVAQIAFKVPKGSVLGLDRRGQLAHRKLPLWPSLTALLKEVVLQAEKQAEEAMTEHRIVDRDTFDHRDNYFIRDLSSYFRTQLKGPMHGTLARIATVVLNKKIDERSVMRALRHAKT